MASIGVFWIYRGVIFGKAVGVEAGVEGVPGIVDSRDDHAAVWEFERPWVPVSSALADVEYQDVPRGRVLSRHGRPLVYADKVLMNADGKRLIAQFFAFDPATASWVRDVHYTTSRPDLDDLFADGGD